MNDVFGGSYDNPADSAQPYLDKIPGYIDKYMDPYINMGQQAGNVAQEQYAKLASNPAAYYQDIYSGYNQSPSYQYQSDQMSKAAENSAAAGGYAGTEADYSKQMEINNALMDQDFSKYMNYIMQLQNTGLQGEQQMYNTGYGASTQALNGMTGYANNSANNQFQGTQAENQMSNAMLSMLMQGGGMLAGGMMGGGSGMLGAGAGWQLAAPSSDASPTWSA
jgi:hypothetical protein